MTSVRTKVKPPANLSLTVSVVGGFAVNLAWTPLAGAWSTSYYVIYRGSDETPEAGVVEFVTEINAVTYRDDTVVEGLGYQYAISTVNVHDVEGTIGSVTGIIIPSAPVWETGWSLSISQGLTESIAIRAADPDGSPLTFSRVGGTAPAGVTVSSAGLVAVGSSTGGTYTLSIRANDGLLTSDITVSITVAAVATAPDTPTNFISSFISATRIDLSWRAALSGAAPTKYQLDFSTSSSGPWTNIVDSLVTSYSHTGRTANTQYFYRVRAHAGALTSGYATTNATTTGTTLTISQGADNPPWPHGAGSIGQMTRVAEWESWMGHTMEIYTAWFSQRAATSWTAMRNLSGPTLIEALDFFVGGRVTMPIVVRMPLVPNDPVYSNRKFAKPGVWDDYAAGAFDADWVAIVAKMISLCNARGRAPNSIIWSLGWEFTGDWYPWSVGDKISQYKTSFGKVVTEIRRQIPGARIDWPPARRKGGVARSKTLAEMMPDPSYITFLSRSLHDGYPHTENDATWNEQLQSNGDSNGLIELANLARANGKQICLSEWGSQIVDDSGTSFGAAPNPALFYQKAWDTWLYPNRDIVAYDTLFQPSHSSLFNRQTHPAAVMFKSKWRQP